MGNDLAVGRGHVRDELEGRDEVGTGCPIEAQTLARKGGDFLNSDSSKRQRGGKA